MKLEDAVTTVRRYVEQQEAIMRSDKPSGARAMARARRLKVLRDCGCVAAGRFSK